MNARLLITSLASSVTLLAHAEDAPKAEQIERLVRASIFTLQPGFNTNAKFKVRKLDVKGLWDEMKTEVVYVDIKIRGQSEPYEPYGFAIYHGGKIVWLSNYSELTSGLVNRGKFYFTCDWGFGVDRSQVVRLRIADGKVEIVESSEFCYQELFVSPAPGGKVQVLLGKFAGLFNHWDVANEIGFVGGTNSSGLEIINADGKFVTPRYK